MTTTPTTRKPIHKITRKDLALFPIWEFATDEEANLGQDETWVKPKNAKSIGLNLYSLSVSAKFKTASKKIIEGLIGITTANGVEFGHAVLLQDNKYIFLPSPDYDGAREERKLILAALGMTETEVFPISFTLKVLISGDANSAEDFLFKAQARSHAFRNLTNCNRSITLSNAFNQAASRIHNLAK